MRTTAAIPMRAKDETRTGPPTTAEARATALDAQVRDAVDRRRSVSLELGGLLWKMKLQRLCGYLGFKRWTDYVNARGLSVGYAERVMRAHRYAEADPRLQTLTPERLLLAVSGMRRENSGRTDEEWIAFAHQHGVLELKQEMKRLTRLGCLPSAATSDGRARAQAVKFANNDPGVSLTLQVPANVKKLFREQCARWGLSPAATLLKLLVREASAEPNE